MYHFLRGYVYSVSSNGEVPGGGDGEDKTGEYSGDWPGQGRVGLLGESVCPGFENLDWEFLEVFERFLLLDEGLDLIFLKNLSISSSHGCILWILEFPIRWFKIIKELYLLKSFWLSKLETSKPMFLSYLSLTLFSWLLWNGGWRFGILPKDFSRLK